ncbi:MAG: PfkB family carbohydrate kinase [Candidatus Omnitrophota bacterium]|nr:sugar kinase [Candidatus Omnitrophota bacterium]MBU2528078.1 sugar kinase [bacterium]MBU3929925.1 sugar kinase [bacterium]MBU4122649.1 sugar kinase [bacterium]
MKENIIVVGSVALDSITTPFGKIDRGVGGSSVYSSLAASFFSPVAIIGVVGADFPEDFLKKMNKKGINTDGIKREPGKTFFWRGKYSWDLSTAISLDTQLNVFEKFDPSVPEALRGSKHLFLANIDPVLQKKVLKQMKFPKSGGYKALDTMNFWIESKKKHIGALLPGLDAILINEAEIRQYTGEHNIIKAARQLLKKGVKTVVVKKGEYGVGCFSKKGMFFLPAYPLEDAVDPTGAGDSFAGAFMGYLASSGKITWSSIKKAAAYGTVISSFTVSGFGVKGLMDLKKSEVDKRYREFVKLVHFEEVKIIGG